MLVRYYSLLGQFGERLKQLVAFCGLQTADDFRRDAADNRLLVIGGVIDELLDKLRPLGFDLVGALGCRGAIDC